MEIKDECYYQVQGFMKNKLGLKGTKRDIYAIIYGFSQDGESEFTGSLAYIIEWLDISKPTAIKALQELVEDNFIIKRVEVINGVTFNRYKANLKILTGSKETLLGVKNFNGDSKEILLGGGKKILPNNKNINDNTNINIIDDLKENKKEKSAEILDYLNLRSGKKYKPVESNLKFIKARLNEAYTEEDLKKVIDIKVAEWKDTKLAKYLRPETLFNATHFESYINQSEDEINSAPPPQQEQRRPSMHDNLQQAINSIVNGGQ